jgi:hypothetical protein
VVLHFENRVIVSEWRLAATSLRQRRMSLWLRTMDPSTRSLRSLAQGDLSSLNSRKVKTDDHRILFLLADDLLFSYFAIDKFH